MIEIIRGDTVHLEVKITDQNENEYQLQEDDKLVFTLKKNCSTKDILIQKNIDLSSFTLSHDETKNLSYGTYVYDVQLTQSNGDVTTVIPPDKFIVKDAVIPFFMRTFVCSLIKEEAKTNVLTQCLT